MSAENLPINYKTQTANTSVRVNILPSKLAKVTTAVVWDSVNPSYNEEFTFSLTRAGLAGKVIKVVVTDHERPGGTKKAEWSSGAISLVQTSPDNLLSLVEPGT